MHAMPSWLHILLAGLWGGVLALERRAFLQAMLSRPLVSATGLGLLLGDVATGVYVGLFFELFFLGGASLGGVHAEHETLPAVAAASFAHALGHSTGAPATPAMWAAAILLFAPAGWLGRLGEEWLDTRARRYLGRARDAADVGEGGRAGRQNLTAMWPHFAFYGLFSAGAMALGVAVGRHFEQLPLPLLRGLAWAYPAMGAMAAALAVVASRASRARLLGGFAAAAVYGVALAAWYREGGP